MQILVNTILLPCGRFKICFLEFSGFFFFRIFFYMHLVESKDVESEDWENQRHMLYSLCILNKMSRLLTDKYIVMCELDR